VSTPLFFRVVCFVTELEHADWTSLTDDELRQVTKTINRAQNLCVDEMVRRVEIERRRL
jgi:predicted Fe-S protein YdhL (DUF1289 family)